MFHGSVPQAGNYEYAANVSDAIVERIAKVLRKPSHDTARMAIRTRTHEQCSHKQHGGAGGDTGDDRHTAIHKSARQKMPKWGKRGLTSPTKNG